MQKYNLFFSQLSYILELVCRFCCCCFFLLYDSDVRCTEKNDQHPEWDPKRIETFKNGINVTNVYTSTIEKKQKKLNTKIEEAQHKRLYGTKCVLKLN